MPEWFDVQDVDSLFVAHLDAVSVIAVPSSDWSSFGGVTSFGKTWTEKCVVSSLFVNSFKLPVRIGTHLFVCLCVCFCFGFIHFHDRGGFFDFYSFFHKLVFRLFFFLLRQQLDFLWFFPSFFSPALNQVIAK
jgi:hypothetical protein